MRKLMLLAAIVAIAVLMMAAAPALADDGNNNDRQLDRKDIKLDKQLLNQNDDNFCHFDCGFNEGLFFNDFGENDDLADELCSPLNPDWINNQVPGCIFGDNNDNFGFFGVAPLFSNDCEWEFEEGWFWIDGHWQWGTWVLDC